MQNQRPYVLSIAGFDPSGGAGVLADVKTFEVLNTYGMAVITASTLQTHDCFVSIDWQEISKVTMAIQTILSNYEIKVIKIGIVKDALFLKHILDAIKKVNKSIFIIWDPVLKSSSGFEFFPSSELCVLKELWRDIDLITPNFMEYQTLDAYLHNPRAILIKGGHRQSDIGLDVLYHKGNSYSFHAKTKKVYDKHGSGCVLSSAIACYLAKGLELRVACEKAKRYIEQFLNSNKGPLGYHYESN